MASAGTLKQQSGDEPQTAQTQSSVPSVVPQKSVDGKNEEISVRGGKERDVRQEEEKLLKEVVNRSREADVEAEKKISSEISEARHSRPSPKIPEDLAQAGVKSPEDEADELLKKGSLVELPISETDYKEGLAIEVKGKVNREGDVMGVSSLAALAFLVKRWIKLAHKHAKKIIFRKKGGA